MRWSLLVFLSLGGGLETLHGFKIGWCVDVGNEMQRLIWLVPVAAILLFYSVLRIALDLSRSR